MRRASKTIKDIYGAELTVSWEYRDSNTNVFTFEDIENDSSVSVNGENALLLMSFMAHCISEFTEER